MWPYRAPPQTGTWRRASCAGDGTLCPVPSAAVASLALKPSIYRYVSGHWLVFFTVELRGKQNISHNPSLSKVGNKRQTERGPRVSRNTGELISLCGSEDPSYIAQHAASIYIIDWPL